MVTFKPGDRVLVPWPPSDVKGEILSLFGSGPEQFARLVIELPAENEAPELRSITLPVKLLRKAA